MQPCRDMEEGAIQRENTLAPTPGFSVPSCIIPQLSPRTLNFRMHHTARENQKRIEAKHRRVPRGQPSQNQRPGSRQISRHWRHQPCTTNPKTRGQQRAAMHHLRCANPTSLALTLEPRHALPDDDSAQWAAEMKLMTQETGSPHAPLRNHIRRVHTARAAVGGRSWHAASEGWGLLGGAVASPRSPPPPPSPPSAPHQPTQV